VAEVPRVKICGIRRREDALAADRLGADFLGVILSEGFARSVDPSVTTRLLEGVNATRVGVLVDEPPERAAELALTLEAGVVQLHGNESPEQVAAMGELGPWEVWKAVRVTRAEDVYDAARRYHGLISALLLEGYRNGVVGGAGVGLELALAEQVCAAVPKGLGLVLAGGLTPENVGVAVARFRPDVVDVSSGVEKLRGRKDPELLRLFIERSRRPKEAPSNPRRGE
jgi:phosphoribosylanthranilate isomerase